MIITVMNTKTVPISLQKSKRKTDPQWMQVLQCRPSTSDEGIQDEEEVKSPARPESQKLLEQNSHIR